jgi:DNA excision repair protein ERCC-2
MKASDSTKLAKEYADLVRGLTEQGIITNPTNQNTTDNSSDVLTSSSSSINRTDTIFANPVLSSDILQEAVPGNIRKAEHFVVFLKKLVMYLRDYLKGGQDVEVKTPLAFLHQLQNQTALERKPLRFTYTRLNSLLRTLEVTSLDEFNSLQDVSNFATLLATYMEGFAIVYEPRGSVISGINEPLLQLCCLDSAIAIKPVIEHFQSVIITSGTLSPIDLYPKLLNFQPIIRESLPMTVFRHCLKPLIVTKGNDQLPISTRFEQRDDISVVRNYGTLLLEIAKNVPDGICCFFTSYQYMERVVSLWDKLRILHEVVEHKLVFLETKDVVETTLALDNFKRACDSGRGAVFLSIARGKVAEGVDFDRHYGRCVILFGVPYQYTKSHVLRARLDFLRERHHIRDNDFLTFDALRQSAQCVGRVIRSKTDYGLVILADARYNKHDKRGKFPPWITQFVTESALNLSIEVAISQIKAFLRDMGQPIDDTMLHSILLSEEQVHKRANIYRLVENAAVNSTTIDVNRVKENMDIEVNTLISNSEDKMNNKVE